MKKSSLNSKEVVACSWLACLLAKEDKGQAHPVAESRLQAVPCCTGNARLFSLPDYFYVQLLR